MKKAVLFLTGAIIMANGYALKQEPVGAPDHLDEQKILSCLKTTPAKPLFPPAANRKAWDSVDLPMRISLIKTAEKKLKKPWPFLTAKDYMLFKRTGNRDAYEKPYWEKRHKIVDLTLGECSEYKGRFMDEIIEGIWQILSEPVWCIPAHESLPKNELFPDPARFQIDIFSATTGRLLCDILALLGPELQKASPFLVQRMKMELMRRIIEPAEKLNDANTLWFRGKNNWTPWCASNLTGCAVYLLDDQPERLAKFINIYLGISRRFYNLYPDDGGCNEGPTYWRYSTGKYIQLLHLLDRRLGMNGKIFEDTKLKRMCEYLPGMNLSGKWFLSVSDASHRLASDARFLAFTAGLVKSPSVMALAQRLKNSPAPINQVTELDGALAAIFTPIPDEKIAEDLPKVTHLPKMGICILRENSTDASRGTVVSLKGGHNAESHNHLDLGHFTLMRCNKPLIVDIGSGVYTAKTFGSQRYTLWYNNSSGHNAPRFNGKGQANNAKYTALITVEKDNVTKALLDNAYPENTGIEKLERKISLNRQNGSVEICDTVQLQGKKKIEITLFTAVKPESFSANDIKWRQGKMTVSNLNIVSVTEEDRLDSSIKKRWGKLWRIELAGEIQESGNWKLNFDFCKK